MGNSHSWDLIRPAMRSSGSSCVSGREGGKEGVCYDDDDMRNDDDDDILMKK